MKTIGIDLTFITNTEGVTGEEVFALGLLKGFFNDGRKQQIIVFILEKFKKELLKIYPGLHVIGVKKGGKKFYKKIKKYLKKTPVDLFYYPHASKMLNVKLKCRTAVTVHGMKSKDASGRTRRIIHRKLRKIGKIAAASEFVKNEVLIKNRNMPSNKITVINNPLSDLRAGIDIVLKKKFILSVNSDGEQKNLIAILKAFNKIQKEIPHDLVVIGSIDENGRAYRLIKRTGLKDRVIVTGMINRDILFGYYRNADLFVNASRYMGFGYTPLEALACETKVLSTKIPSIAAIPGVECDGYINNPHNYLEIANKMLITLYKNTEKNQMKERAGKIKDYYSIKKAAGRYAAFLNM